MLLIYALSVLPFDILRSQTIDFERYKVGLAAAARLAPILSHLSTRTIVYVVNIKSTRINLTMQPKITPTHRWRRLSKLGGTIILAQVEQEPYICYILYRVFRNCYVRPIDVVDGIIISIAWGPCTGPLFTTKNTYWEDWWCIRTDPRNTRELETRNFFEAVSIN